MSRGSFGSLKKLWSYAVVALAVMTTSAIGQMETGSVAGLVTDPSGSALPGTRLTLVDIQHNTTVSVKTNNRGFYRFAGVEPGLYRLEVQHDGFKIANVTRIILNTQDEREENIHLEVGSVAESVTVMANGVQVNTSDASISTVIDQEFVKNIPLNGRTFQSLLLLTPGMVFTPGEEGQLSVNGGRTDANTFSVDGVSGNIGTGVQSLYDQSASGSIPGFNSFGGTQNLLSLDAMQEVKISTSTYSAEYGRQPGGQVSLVSKSGTKLIHGSLYDYLRNSATDANDWFSDQLGLKQVASRQNDFGGTFGGPILIPHLYDGRQKGSFFFVDYEGLRLALPQPTRAFNVPAACLHGNATLNHQLQELVAAFPVPNTTPGACVTGSTGEGTFTTGYDNYTNMNTEALRLDQTINSKWSVFFRADHSESEGEIYTLAALARYPLRTDTETLGVDTQFSSSLSNSFRLNFSKNVAENNDEWTTRFGVTPIPDIQTFLPEGAPNYAVPDLLIGGEAYETGPYTYHRTAVWNAVETTRWQHGGHFMTFGTDLKFTQPKYIDNGYIFQVSFSRYANLINNSGSGSLITSIPTQAKLQAMSFFANDEWRLNKRFVLNYGLRWEINPPAALDGYALPTFVNFPNASTLALAPVGTPYYPTFLGEFAPRLGVTYQLRRGAQFGTVLRAGWGLYYDLGAGTELTASHAYPFSVSTSIALQPFPFAAASVTAPTLPAPLSTPLPSGGYKNIENLVGLPRTQQYSISLEQQLGKSQIFTVSYVGNHGQRLLSRYLYDYLSSTPTIAAGNNFTVTRNDGEAAGFSWYNGLQLNYRRDFSKGLQVLANYTYSHALDAGSNDSNFGTSKVPNDLLSEDASLNYGSSDFDRRSIFNFAIVYNIPRLHSQSGVARVTGDLFLNGWILSPNFKYQSGAPFSMVVNYYDIAGGTGLSSYYLDRVPGVPLTTPDIYNRGGRAFNPAAFAIPAAELQPTAALNANGDTSRNNYNGPPLTQLDFALRRDFHIHARLSLQFSAEFFNLLNHPNFLAPDGNYGYIFNLAGFGPSSCPGSPSGLSCEFNFPDPRVGTHPTSGFTLGTFGELNTLANGVTSGAGPGSSFDVSLNPRYALGGPRSSQFSLRLSF